MRDGKERAADGSPRANAIGATSVAVTEVPPTGSLALPRTQGVGGKG